MALLILQGPGPELFELYEHFHGGEPFQEQYLSPLLETSNFLRSRLRRELWVLLFGQTSSISSYYTRANSTAEPDRHRHIAQQYAGAKSIAKNFLAGIGLRFQRGNLSDGILSTKTYPEIASYNKIALFVEVLASSMGLDERWNREDETEEEINHRLELLVAICRTNSLYIGPSTALDSWGSNRIHLHSQQTHCKMWSHMRIGDILVSLYAEGVLEEPMETDLPGHRFNAAKVLASLYPLRIFITEFDWKDHMHSRDICPDARVPHDILRMEMKDLIQICKKAAETSLVKASGHQFSLRPLNIKQLRIIGNVSVEWTNKLSEHLQLSLKDYPVLKLYWFAWATLDIPLAR